MTSSRLLRTAAALLSTGIVITLLARWSEVQPGPLVVAVAATPYLVFAGLLAALLAVWGRAKVIAAAALGLAVFAAATQVPLYQPTAAASGAPVLRVATSNLLYGRADLSQLLRLVQDQQVDVLALQEMPLEAADRLRELGLESTLPHRYLDTAPGRAGSGIWSRWPLTEGRPIPGIDSNPLARVDVPGLGPVTVGSLHPAAPNPVVNHWWHREQDVLGDELEKLTGTVVVAGDLNATHDHALLRRLARSGYGDAAGQTGAGLMRTWPYTKLPVPLFTLDHVLSKGPVAALSVTKHELAGTDHAAVVAELGRTGG